MIRKLCQCGCGKAVRRHANSYASIACVPIEARQAGGRRSRERYRLNRRAKLLGDLLKRLDAIERPTRLDLMAVFDMAYLRGYDSGYHAAEYKLGMAQRLRTT